MLLERLICFITAKLIGWLIGLSWFIDWLIDCLWFDWLFACLVCVLVECLDVWLFDVLTLCLSEWIDCLNCYLIC